MKYTLCVIVPMQDKELLADFMLNYPKNPDPYLDMFAEKLAKPLEKYDIYRETPPRKEYLGEGEVQRIMDHYGTSDPEEIAKRIQDWRGEQGGLDRGGFFVTTRANPHGKMDYWSVFDVVTMEHMRAHMEEILPHMLLLPDLKLIESTRFIPYGYEPNEQQWQAWSSELQKWFAKFPDALVVLVKCHV